MHQYIFDESEWKNFKEEKYGHTLVAVDGSHYQSIDMGAMEARLPGSETYDRLLGVNSFPPRRRLRGPRAPDPDVLLRPAGDRTDARRRRGARHHEGVVGLPLRRA